jgi:enamine deaminase RidA (YjgF/YER057c/UK114 family)
LLGVAHNVGRGRSAGRERCCPPGNQFAVTPQHRLDALGVVLPPAPKPVGVYKPALIVGQHLYLSGHGPLLPDGTLMRGRIGRDFDLEGGKRAARQVGLTMLATILTTLGSLDRVRRVIKVLGMVNCTADFEKHPAVINGASELFAEIWGPDQGIGVRSAVGAGSLPDGMAVEIEALFELA